MKSPADTFQVDALRVIVHESRDAAGLAASIEVAKEIARLQARGHRAKVVFAAAPSQDEFLAHLVRNPAIDWSRVVAFHMDEYLGLKPDHPASFRRYLADHLFQPTHLQAAQLRQIPGEWVERPLQVCLDYENALRAEPPDLVCGGIGENGHLAFNDPPVADFLDPVRVKVVRLDDSCRHQQVHDGCFARFEDVPSHAFTMTVPALLAAPMLSIVVPGARKGEAIKAALEGTISESCPASILRKHAGATLHLDRDSARMLI